jgi:hypothetical protein
MPAIGSTVRKDKDAAKVYAIEWADYLEGKTITDAVWTIRDSDTALVFDSPSIVGTKTQARVLGGTVGRQYIVSCRITMSGTPAQIEEESFSVLVVEN